MHPSIDPGSLRAQFRAAVDTSGDARLRTDLVLRAADMGQALVRMRRRSGRWAFLDTALDDRDVALDALAEAFQTDAAGCMVRIASYLEAIDWKRLDDEQLVTALRRFVFRKVEDGVYRMFQERDPQLSRMIRSLRGAVERRSDVQLVRFERRQWVCLTGSLPSHNGSPIPVELLERRLVVREGHRGTELLEATVRVLSNQSMHLPAVPVVSLALAIRASLARLQRPEPPATTPAEEAQWQEAVVRATTAVSRGLRESYAGKLPQEWLERYARAAQLVLLQGYRHSEAVGHQIPGASANYRDQHRKVFEYILRKTRSKLAAFYKSDASALSSM
ncbi:MAG: hypothetical protein JJ896_09690 [Rhodothermales bacterium]|nr:hypothetical protein [Rhodothermales bacterium]MBO6779911.1 hypothetical protein [Rhodothermales bacterium]